MDFMKGKTYLGDGLYMNDDGYQVGLFTERGAYVHEVYLDSQVLNSFFKVLEKSREIKITVEMNPDRGSDAE